LLLLLRDTVSTVQEAVKPPEPDSSSMAGLARQVQVRLTPARSAS
jgi:hypothetical protein